MLKKIKSGGQTGADQAGLDAAIKLGSPMAVGFQMRELPGRPLNYKFLFKKGFRSNLDALLKEAVRGKHSIYL